MLLILLAFKGTATLASGMGRQMDVSFLAMGKLLLTLLPLVLVGTALITALAAGAKSMKEAQSHVMWMMMLPMLPAYALMAYPLKDTDLWQYAVPFLSQNQLVQKVTRGESPDAQQWAVYLGCALALAAALWLAGGVALPPGEAGDLRLIEAPGSAGDARRSSGRGQEKARRSPGFFVARCRPGYCWNAMVRRVVVASATGWKRQRFDRRGGLALELALVLARTRRNADHAHGAHAAVGPR
jgi:hypothetical protein